jgi:hypothetical protein
MAEDTGEVLRRSLDAVDRHRKRLVMGLALLTLLLVGTFIVGSAHSADTVTAVLAHLFMLLIWVTALTVVVVIQITVMTKRILRAIELASRRT